MADPVIEGFILPESLSRTLQNKICFPGRLSFQSLGDFGQTDCGCDEDMNVVRKEGNSLSHRLKPVPRLSSGFEAVPDIANRLDVGRAVRIGLDFRSKRRNATVDAARSNDNGVAPYRVQDVVAG